MSSQESIRQYSVPVYISSAGPMVWPCPWQLRRRTCLAVSAGYRHTLALRTNGTVTNWGDPDGVANWVPTNLTGVKAVAAAWDHNVALLTNGLVTAWGYNGADIGWHLTDLSACW